MESEKDLLKEFLTGRAIRFYNRYEDELQSVKQLLTVRLEQIALAYTLQNNLPKESVQITSRVKKIGSFLKKLERKNWPEFYYPTEVVTDLIGARVICWFHDDCYGILEAIESSPHFSIRVDSKEDYIVRPKPSGYRSIHLLGEVSYDRVDKSVDGKRRISPGMLVSEIQIRTKLQDAWGEFTHEMHYKVPGGVEKQYESLVAQIANRLAAEDLGAVALRDILQKKISTHQGLTGS